MFDFLFPNHPFGGHTLRLVAQAQRGGADVFDIARAMKAVEAGDNGTWEQASLSQPKLKLKKRWLAVMLERQDNIFSTPIVTTACRTCYSRLPMSRSARS